mmetsp:Transcript_12247/g.47583  ORF Transcript_12247/g.47583 Transcript_12247/m.47583 type:complete len:304 (-) Transcript_12247:893-1804(-)
MFRLKRRVQKLRGILWSGCPSHLRPICWKISLGYIPPTFQRHHETLRRKRAEYHSFSAEYFESNRVMNADELDILDQIQIDIPRTDSLRNLLHDERIKMAIERVLFIRAIRNPATSYVQGMTDLVTPFFSVFSSEIQSGKSLTGANDETLFDNVEADCYWCLCKVLDTVQDHFTCSQPGIQRVCHRVNELVSRLDRALFEHLAREGVGIFHFAFRWATCLLLREFSGIASSRAMDTYISEGDNLSDFVAYLCTALLLRWAEQLKAKKFHDVISFLQQPPSVSWKTTEVEVVLAEAFQLRSLLS